MIPSPRTVKSTCPICIPPPFTKPGITYLRISNGVFSRLVVSSPGRNIRLTNNMKFTYLFFFLLSAPFSLFGAPCDCLQNMTAFQQKVEANQASYQHQVVEQGRLNEYIRFRTAINQQAGQIANKKDCIGLIALYLSFFRDEHAFISYENNDTPEPNRMVKPDPKRRYEPLPFEGVWYFGDGSFSINVFGAQTAFGEWAGAIREDKSTFWKKGQLKIEFFRTSDSTFQAIYWRTNLIPVALRVSWTDSSLKIGRHLTFYRQKQAVQEHSDAATDLHFESWSGETNYLRIPSFDLSFKDKIDSLIARNRKEILAKKNLIIDVRNNGGGGFEAFQPLLPYVLDTNLTAAPYGGSVWVSADNYAYYDQTKYEYAETKQDSILEQQYVAFLKAHYGHFTPVETIPDTIEPEVNSPANVGIIFNRNTASTAEGFILQAKTSGKVRTFGENSAGAVSYGDWMPVALPELNIRIAITTKKMVFKANEDFESIGISPDVDLTYANEKEWLKIVLEQLEKKGTTD